LLRSVDGATGLSRARSQRHALNAARAEETRKCRIWGAAGASMKPVLGTAKDCGCRFGTGLGLLLALAGGSAEGQEFCVACSDPPGVYRCVIDGAQRRGGQSLQMLGVTAMAKEGGHATCSVKRGTVFDCDGAVKRIPWTALEPLSQSEVSSSRDAPALPATPAA